MKFWISAAMICALVSSAAIAKPLRSGVDQRGIDSTVRPQDDLFMHLNGEWLKHTPIPAEKSSYGSFEILADESEVNIRAIITEAIEGNPPAGSDLQKIGDFFLSYMDEETINQRGVQPLQKELAKIDQLTTKQAIVEHLGYLQTLDVGGPLGFYVDQDDKNSTQYLAAVVQSGTSLPDRDYYLKDDEKYLSARTALKKYITTLFELSNLPNGEQAAEAVLAIETKLAEAQWTRTELRDADKRYNKYQVSQLDELTPGFPWKLFFAAVRVPELTELNVVTPSFFQKTAKLFDEILLNSGSTT